MTIPKLAPNKFVRYRWTKDDAGLVRQTPAPEQKPTSTFSVTPYGINPKDERTVKETGSGTEKRLSQLEDGNIALIPLHYSNSWYPFRSTRFFDDAYNWEKRPSEIKAKTLGELCRGLFNSNPARYPHYDLSVNKNPEEGWRIFDYWEHTDFRWAFLKSRKLSREMDPFSIPTEIPDPVEARTVRNIVWVRYKIPPLQIVVVAPTPPGAPDARKHKATVPLLTQLDKDSWQFRLVKDQIIAVAVGQARYADLADGSLGTGSAKAGTTVDITRLFPEWVKKALTAQTSTGFVVDQPDLTREPIGYSTTDYEFGYGNCHGFTAKIFKLFDDLSITVWKDLTVSYEAPDASAAPKGAPVKLQEVDPRYLLVQLLTGTSANAAPSETPITVSAQRNKWDQAQGAKWSGVVDLGRNTFVRRVLSAGATALSAGASPGFGDLGVQKPGFSDHSVIALGVAGGNTALVYALQKVQGLAPYAVYTQKMKDFDWYRRSGTPGKPPIADR